MRGRERLRLAADLECVADVLVTVDHFGDGHDEADADFRHEIRRRRFAGKDDRARGLGLALGGRHLLELAVAMDDAEDVHLLALVPVRQTE